MLTDCAYGSKCAGKLAVLPGRSLYSPWYHRPPASHITAVRFCLSVSSNSSRPPSEQIQKRRTKPMQVRVTGEDCLMKHKTRCDGGKERRVHGLHSAVEAPVSIYLRARRCGRAKCHAQGMNHASTRSARAAMGTARSSATHRGAAQPRKHT